MTRKDLRRSERLPCILPARLAWTDARGLDRFMQGKCRDISHEGLRIDTLESITPGSNVSLRVERVDVAGSARVRYVRRSGAGHVIGLELSQKVRQQLLDMLRKLPSGSRS